MKIKILKRVPGHAGKSILPGEILEARIFATTPFQFNAPFQITDGEFSGAIVQREFAMEIKDEKLYTEKEFNDLKEHYLEKLKKEQDQAVLFQTLSRDLTDQIKQKNKELERANFFIDILSIAFKASCEAIQKLKEEKAY